MRGIRRDDLFPTGVLTAGGTLGSPQSCMLRGSGITAACITIAVHNLCFAGSAAEGDVGQDNQLALESVVGARTTSRRVRTHKLPRPATRTTPFSDLCTSSRQHNEYDCKPRLHVHIIQHLPPVLQDQRVLQ